jgi:hypothetical protein
MPSKRRLRRLDLRRRRVQRMARPGRVHRAPGGVGDDGLGEGAEDGQPNRAADHMAGVDQAGGQAGVLVINLGQGDQGQRHGSDHIGGQLRLPRR